jgi:hypothetical protein|nr:MAG TPA: hypothetical protein [Caudoviricetes sp.]
MIASGKLYPAEGTANNPLIAAQSPMVSTATMKATTAIKALQPVVYSGSGASVATTGSSGGSSSFYGIAATSAEQNGVVEVYTAGCFNVEALDVSAITAASGKTGKELLAVFEDAIFPTFQLVLLHTDTAVPTV